VAARQLSFTRAADELNVTQSAVSHQIKHLEDLWEVKLFHRRNRRLELTDAGEALAPVAREFFQRLERTLDDIIGDQGHEALQVQVVPSFAVKWLVPRLEGFRETHPDIDVWISTSLESQVTLQNGRMDVAIHLGSGEYPGLESIRLMDEQIFPVCRPYLLEEYGVPADPAELCRLPLLLRHHEISRPTWEFWFQQVGVAPEIYGPALSDGTRYADSNMAVQAAFEGLGVALGRRAHVWDDIRSGRLVRLFDLEVAAPDSYYFVYPPDQAERPAITAFRKWLVAEVERAMVVYRQCPAA
jgi:LysR family glycine cleavage system transcriptional activator